MNKKPTVLLFGAAVFVLSLVPYLRVGGFDWVNLDDYTYLVGTPVEKGLSWANVKWAFCSMECMGNWHPLTWLSYMADASLWRLDPGMMHIHNALLHAADAVLLFLLLLLVLEKVAGLSGCETVWSAALQCRSGSGGLQSDEGGRRTDVRREKAVLKPRTPNRVALLVAAAFGALFWSLHPLRVESVAWVSERKDVLFLFWELLALIFWVKQAGEASLPYALSIGCFALACLAKPAAVTFPVLACLLEYLTTRRVRFAALVWPLPLALALGAVTQCAQAAGGAMVSMAGVPFLARLANAVAAFGTYCWKLAVPTGLAVPYPHPWPEWPPFLLPGAAICAGYAAVLLWSGWRSWSEAPPWPEWAEHVQPKAVAWIRRVAGISAPVSGLRPPISDTSRVVFVGLAWFPVAVAPMLGLMNFGYQSHADRYTYLPGLGFALIAAAGLAALFRRGWRVRVAAGSAMAALLVGWAALSWRQAQHWRSTVALFTHAIEVTGEKNIGAMQGLGLYLFGATGSAETALPYWDKSFRCGRERLRLARTAAYVFLLAKAGRLDEAKAETRGFSEWAERQRSGDSEADILSDGQRNERSNADTCSTEVKTCYAAIAYYGGDRELAREHAEGVLQKRKGSLIAHYLLGQMAVEDGQVPAAVAHWKVSVENNVFFTFLKVRIAELEAAQGRSLQPNAKGI